MNVSNGSLKEFVNRKSFFKRIGELTTFGSPRLDVQTLTTQEEFNLVQRVFLTPGREALRIVIFSGVGHGSGCSHVCARAGEILAAEGQGSVCIVDANLLSPSLHNYFGVDNRGGWTEALAQSGSIRALAQLISPPNLWLLPSGPPTQEDILSHSKRDRLQSRLADLRAEFDYVLIDAPPANLATDPILLGPMTDGVILVLEAHATRRETARKTKERLEAAGARLLAAVLNKRTFPVPEALYRKW